MGEDESGRSCDLTSPLSAAGVVQFLSYCLSWIYITLPSGGSDAVAAGEGFRRGEDALLAPAAMTLSGPESPTLPEGE